MGKILVVGIAAVDVINTVPHYPGMDEEVRAISQRIVTGGNACNSAVVLAQLGDQVAWTGVLAADPLSDSIRQTLSEYRIDYSHAVTHEQGQSPVSYINVVEGNAARSIVHYRRLPEYSAAEFDSEYAGRFDWVHFEGRNIADTLNMMQSVSALSSCIISVEIEKPRDGIEALIPLAEIVFYSQPYVLSQAYKQPEDFLNTQHVKYDQATHVLTWGEQGAIAINQSGELFRSSANQGQGDVVDTVAAGDTFNAGFIHAMQTGCALQESLDVACRLAGIKCAHQGLYDLPIAEFRLES